MQVELECWQVDLLQLRCLSRRDRWSEEQEIWQFAAHPCFARSSHADDNWWWLWGAIIVFFISMQCPNRLPDFLRGPSVSKSPVHTANKERHYENLDMKKHNDGASQTSSIIVRMWRPGEARVSGELPNFLLLTSPVAREAAQLQQIYLPVLKFYLHLAQLNKYN